MPDWSNFKKGFGLNLGLQISDYELIKVQGKEEVITTYRHYAYPLQLTFECKNGTCSVQKLLTELSHYTHHKAIICSQYKNPYICTIEIPKTAKLNGKNRQVVTIKATGYCSRTFSNKIKESRCK